MKTAMVALGVVMVLGLAKLALSEQVKVTRIPTVNGVLVRLDGRDLIVRVKQLNGEPKEITLTTDDSTEVHVDGEAGTVDDLRPQMLVQITSGVRNVAAPARAVRATSKSLIGVVLRLDGRNVVVRAQGQGDKEVVVETDSRTQIFLADLGAQKLVNQTAAQLEDLKPGMRLKVNPDSGTARKIVGIAKVAAKKSEK